MSVMFDPNAPLDFESQAREVERQKQLAQFLRSRAAGAQPAQGRIVGGHYVPPDLGQALMPAVNGLAGMWADKQAAEAASKYGANVAQAQQQWTSSLPRATAAVPGRAALPGPPEANGSPDLNPVEAVPARLPDRATVLKATLDGMRIPGNEKNAELWNRGMDADLTREDNQVARKELADAQTSARTQDLAFQAQSRKDSQEAQLKADAERRKADLEQRERDSARRSEDQRLSIEQRRDAAAEATAARLEIAKMHGATVAALAALKADKPKELKPLPAAQAKAWIENSAGIASVDNALEIAAKRPKSFGMQHYMLPDAITQRTDPEGVAARAAVANLGSLRIHDRSGAAVTASETPRLKPFIPSAGDDYKTIVKKLNGFKREYQMIQQEILDLADSQGYKVPGKVSGDAPDKPAAPASGGKPPPGLKLPPGFTYVGPAQ